MIRGHVWLLVPLLSGYLLLRVNSLTRFRLLRLSGYHLFLESALAGAGLALSARLMVMLMPPGTLPAIDAVATWWTLTLPGSGSITGLEFERKCPHGVSSRAPNLDVLLTGPAGVIGIESKLTEPLSRHRAVFSPRYRERIRDERRESAWFHEMLALEEDPKRYAWLDAAQLVKHAFGLAHTFPDGTVTLLYLYWEPRNAERFPLFVEHRREIDAFSRRVAGSRPSFRTMTYPELWRTWSAAPPSWLTVHLDALRARYEVEI